MEIFRKVVRYSLIGIVVLVILTGEYHIYFKKGEYSKIHRGIVIHAYESIGRRSSVCLATVKFDNGDVQEVNTGSYLYSVGENFSGQLSWDPIMGVSGFAYTWHPSSSILFFVFPAMWFNTIAIGYILFLLVRFAFFKHTKS